MPRAAPEHDENVAQTSCLPLALMQAGSLRYGVFVVNFRKAYKLQIKAAKQQRIIRRHSALSVSLGGEAFPPNFTEVAESRRESPKKNFGRMICRQNYFKSFCRQIILP